MASEDGRQRRVSRWSGSDAGADEGVARPQLSEGC